jgi:hypothetical protein
MAYQCRGEAFLFRGQWSQLQYFLSRSGSILKSSIDQAIKKLGKDAPEKELVPFHNEWNKQTFLYKTGEYYLHYYGNSQKAAAERRLAGTFSGDVEIPMPEKPYMAVRARQKISDQ